MANEDLASRAPEVPVPEKKGEPAGAKEKGFVVKAFMTHADTKRLGELAQAVADGKLQIPIARRFPLAEAAAAHETAERGVNGKILLLG